jgi:hypothetical protein
VAGEGVFRMRMAGWVLLRPLPRRRDLGAGRADRRARKPRDRATAIVAGSHRYMGGALRRAEASGLRYG